MKLITEIKSLNHLSKYHVDGIIFSYEKYSAISDVTFSLLEIQKIVQYCKQNNKISILKIDKIFSEYELDEFYSFLEEMISLNIDYYIFSDMAVLFYMKRKKRENRLIYSAKTLNCSYQDCLYFQKLGVKVILSNELTLDDIKETSSLDNIVLDGYGYSQIFYSKRKLLSLFKEYLDLPQDVKNKLLFMKEATRIDKYPVYENANGTFIFTSYKYLFYQELAIVNHFSMFRIESLFISEDDLFKVIDIYKRALTNEITEEDYQKLLAIDNNVGHRFLYEKSRILESDDV